MRLRHLQLVEAPMSPEEHAQQKSWVEQSERRATRSQERRDETTVQARMFCLARERARVENVVPLHPRQPEPPAAA